jgi:release factor glutamine methyltransferase
MVSNPPYIRSGEIAGLATEVRDHDPRLALDGGEDGLAAYRAIAPEAMRLLAPGGVLAVELGYDQSADVEALMTAAGLTSERPPKVDLASIRRAAAFRKLPR